MSAVPSDPVTRQTIPGRPEGSDTPVNRARPAEGVPPDPPDGPAAARRPVGPRPPSRFTVPARPPIVDESALFGLSRRSRGRVGSLVFTLFFVFVYAVIALQLIVALLGPSP